MTTDTKNPAAGEDLCFHFCAPLKMTVTGPWQQLQDEGFIPFDIEQPAGNTDQWTADHKHYKLARKARPGSGSRKRAGSDWWALTVEDLRFNWDDVMTHERRRKVARSLRAPTPGAVARARMDRPFSAWLKATCRAA